MGSDVENTMAEVSEVLMEFIERTSPHGGIVVEHESRQVSLVHVGDYTDESTARMIRQLWSLAVSLCIGSAST